MIGHGYILNCKENVTVEFLMSYRVVTQSCKQEKVQPKRVAVTMSCGHDAVTESKNVC